MGLSSHEQHIVHAAQQRGDEMLRELKTLVDIPTGPGSSGLDETRSWFCSRLGALGAKTTLHEGEEMPAWLIPGAGNPPPTAVCEHRSMNGGVHFLLCGHIDTVHEVSSPFNSLSIAPDRKTCTGPGAVDMKGGLLVALHALEILAEVGCRVSWSFAINSDEETGSFASTKTLAQVARQATIGLVFEPAMVDGGLVIERTGSGQFMIDVKGRSAHVGRDFTKGVSAVHALARSIVSIADLADPDNGVITNIGPIRADQPSNVVSDHACAWGNVRFANAELAEKLGKAFDSIQTAPDSMPRIEIKRAFNRPGKPATPEVMRLAHAARSVAEDLGQTLPFGKTGGVCDGNTLQAAGLPTLDTLGVRGGGLHTPNEWVDIPSLVERAQLTAILMRRLSECSA